MGRELHMSGTGRLALSVAMAVLTGIADAQQGAVDQGATLEEVVVTAQKRTEREVDVPISMAVLDGTTLAEQGNVNLQDITAKVPGVNLAMDTGTRRVFIRGVGSGSNGGFEQSVGQFVDGVYHGRSLLSTSMMFDVQRVEVLKGPQSTFFGNNTVAGAISVTTAQPTQQDGGSISALYEPVQKERSVDLMLNGALTSTLSGRIAARYYGIDGWMHNESEGDRRYPRSSGYGARGTLKWTPAEAVDVALKVEQSRVDTNGALDWQMVDCPPDTRVASGPTGPACGLALALVPGFESKFDTYFSGTPGQKGWLDTDEYALTAGFGLPGGLQLTSITSYSDYDNLSAVDADTSALDLIHVDDGEQYDQFSQELRLASDAGQPLSWMAGVYYQQGTVHKQVFINQPIATLPASGPPLPSAPSPVELDLFNQHDRLYSGFGALSWQPAEAWKFDAGVRWSQAHKSAERGIDTGTDSSLGFDRSGYVMLAQGTADHPLRNDSGFTPSVGAQYHITKDRVLYAKYAHGWKAGGFAQTEAEDGGHGFNPEKADTVEVGFKADQLAGGSLRLDVAAFLSEFTDLQQSNFIGFSASFSPEFLIQNVGKSRSRGLEADFVWAATGRLSFDGGLELLDAIASRYPNGPCGEVCPDESTTNPGTQDLSGKTLPYSAHVSGNLGLVYDLPLGGSLGLKSDLSTFFTSRYYTMATLDPYTIQPGYYKVDARIELHQRSDRWYVALVGKNLNNAYTSQWSSDVATSPGTYFKILDRTRSVAVQGGLKF